MILEPRPFSVVDRTWDPMAEEAGVGRPDVVHDSAAVVVHDHILEPVTFSKGIASLVPLESEAPGQSGTSPAAPSSLPQDIETPAPPNPGAFAQGIS
jgi:hypothetical protein